MAGLQFNPNVKTEQQYYQINSPFGFGVRGVNGPEGGYAGGGGVVETASNISGRAVDKLPKAEMHKFQEDLRAQAGYDAGVSTLTMWA